MNLNTHDSCASHTAWRWVNVATAPAKRKLENSKTRKTHKTRCKTTLPVFSSTIYKLMANYRRLYTWRTGQHMSMERSGVSRWPRGTPPDGHQKKKREREKREGEIANEMLTSETISVFWSATRRLLLRKAVTNTATAAAPRNSLLHNFVLAFACSFGRERQRYCTQTREESPIGEKKIV